jgi:hypothetical protein
VKQFIARHAAKIVGVLNGWDRIVFRGTLGRGRFNSVRGMRYYLNTSRILLKRKLSNSFLGRLVPQRFGAIYSLRRVSRLGTRHRVKSFWA